MSSARARRPHIAIAAALAGLAACAPASAAGTVIKIKQCDEQSLRAAVAAAPSGATVRFGCDGTITLTPEGGNTLEVAANATFDRRLTIDGSGHDVTLSGGNKVRVLVVDGGADVTLRRLTVTGGRTGEVLTGGAGVLAFGPLTVDHVEFRGNRAFEFGGAIATNGPGAPLTVTHSRFVDNGATCSVLSGGGGGAIAVMGLAGAVIRSSTFERNFTEGAGAGGAIAGLPPRFGVRETDPITVTDSRFEGNLAEGSGTFFINGTTVGGGAIGVVDRGLSLDHDDFLGNVARSYLHTIGGAISATSTPRGAALLPPVPLTVERSTFDRNATQAADNGLFTPIVFGGAIGISGAIYPVNIARSRLTQNTSQRGAAIWATGVAVSIDRSLVAGNTATGIDAIPGDAALSSSGTFTFAHTMLRDNAPASCQLGAVVDGGHNSEAGGTSCFDAKPPK